MFSAFSSSYVMRAPDSSDTNDTHRVPSRNNVQRQEGTDPGDFSWVRRWAVVGDSYTAGIGAGTQLSDVFHPGYTWWCSRYYESYPMVINNILGSEATNFQFQACSGDRTRQIYQQIEGTRYDSFLHTPLQGNLDLVMLTAGGNDLCLVS